jgi:hypothetical protein
MQGTSSKKDIMVIQDKSARLHVMLNIKDPFNTYPIWKLHTSPGFVPYLIYVSDNTLPKFMFLWHSFDMNNAR